VVQDDAWLPGLYEWEPRERDATWGVGLFHWAQIELNAMLEPYLAGEGEQYGLPNRAH